MKKEIQKHKKYNNQLAATCKKKGERRKMEKRKCLSRRAEIGGEDTKVSRVGSHLS